MNKYYVYLYIDPVTFAVRYIGKGTRDRASVHIRRAWQGNYPVENKALHAWINSLYPDGKYRRYDGPIVVKVATGMTEDAAYALEAQLIELHKNNKKNMLLNKKKGGTN